MYPPCVDNEEELDRIIVNDKGEINDPSCKIFSASIIHKKKELAQNGKIIKNIIKSNKRRIDESIKKDSGIFSGGILGDINGKGKRNISSATVTSGAYSHSEGYAVMHHGFHAGPPSNFVPYQPMAQANIGGNSQTQEVISCYVKVIIQFL